MKYIVCILMVLVLGSALAFAVLPGFPEGSREAEVSSRLITAKREMTSPAAEAVSQPESILPAEAPASPVETEEPSSPAAEGSKSSGEGSSAPKEGPASPAESSSSAPAESSDPPVESSSVPAESPAPPPKEPVPPQPREEWMLRLVNRENPLPMDFEPEYEAVQNRFVMDKRVAPIARQMIADAQAQGVILVVNSAYRPYYAQQQVYNNYYQRYIAEGRSEQEALWLTESYVALPGCSEHQLGLAMDIVAVDSGETARGWLAAHAPDYGFILRYPEDKTEITHTAYESWHYRFVGVPTAREITDRGLCLEEFLAGLG